jgi:hypothetical protein
MELENENQILNCEAARRQDEEQRRIAKLKSEWAQKNGQDQRQQIKTQQMQRRRRYELELSQDRQFT